MRSIDRSNSVAKRPSASASATTATTATSSSSSSAASSTRSSTIRSTAAEGGSSMTCTAAATAAAAGNAFCRPSSSSSSAEAARNEASCEDIASTASAEIPPLLAHLSTQFVTATRHHLALGALQYQRCSYRSSTEHYQRAINFLMRREDALARHSHDGSGNAAFRHQHRQQQQQQAAIEDELAVEIEKMEFYTYVLRLNNRRDMDVLRNSVSRTSPVTTLTTATATSTSTTSTSAPTVHHHPQLVRPMRPQDLMPRCRHAPVLPPPRLAFYLDEHNASYILDSHVRAHQVLANNNIDTAANNQGQDPDEQQTIHLLQAYVMYNLALCHVALGSYSEALNLLQMVVDVASTTTGSTSTSSSGCDQNTITTLTPTIASTRSYDLPAELGDIMGRYQSFVKEVRVAAAAAAAATSSSTTATTTTNLPSSLPSPGAPTSTAHNNDDDMDVDRDDDDDDVDEEDGDIPLSLPASAA